MHLLLLSAANSGITDCATEMEMTTEWFQQLVHYSGLLSWNKDLWAALIKTKNKSVAAQATHAFDSS